MAMQSMKYDYVKNTFNFLHFSGWQENMRLHREVSDEEMTGQPVV